MQRLLYTNSNTMPEIDNRFNTTFRLRSIVTRLLDGNRQELNLGTGVWNADVGGVASNVEQLRISQPPVASQPATNALVVLQTGGVEEEAFVIDRLGSNADRSFVPC